MSLSRAVPPQRDTPDPTSAPIRRVLNAFQGNANSSGTSTKAALQQIDEIREAVPAVPFQDTESGAALAVATGRAEAAPPAPADDKLDQTPPSIIVEAPPLPAPPVVAPAGVVAPAPVVALRTDATPAAVVREASNSTSPGAASFAEGPSSAGRADDFDDSDRRAIAPARAFDIVAFLKTTRGMAIAGGAAVLVIVLLVVALKGGGSSKKASGRSNKNANVVATTDRGSADSQTDENGGAGATGMRLANGGTPAGSGEGDGEAAPDEGSGAEGSGSDATAETGSDAVTPEHPVKKAGGTDGAKKAAPTIGGKQVVLEYDNQARDAAAIPNTAAKGDQGAIARARTSYAAGNQRLFAGDADGAVRYYKQALGYYPAYVAGYRGLGLAYSQQGNKTAALQAFRTYVSSVPSAKDTPLIRKRIANLQAK